MTKPIDFDAIKKRHEMGSPRTGVMLSAPDDVERLIAEVEALRLDKAQAIETAYRTAYKAATRACDHIQEDEDSDWAEYKKETLK